MCASTRRRSSWCSDTREHARGGAVARVAKGERRVWWGGGWGVAAVEEGRRVRRPRPQYFFPLDETQRKQWGDMMASPQRADAVAPLVRQVRGPLRQEYMRGEPTFQVMAVRDPQDVPDPQGTFFVFVGETSYGKDAGRFSKQCIGFDRFRKGKDLLRESMDQLASVSLTGGDYVSSTFRFRAASAASTPLGKSTRRPKRRRELVSPPRRPRFSPGTKEAWSATQQGVVAVDTRGITATANTTLDTTNATTVCIAAGGVNVARAALGFGASRMELTKRYSVCTTSTTFDAGPHRPRKPDKARKDQPSRGAQTFGESNSNSRRR